jgi:hypothetical protein
MGGWYAEGRFPGAVALGWLSAEPELTAPNGRLPGAPPQPTTVKWRVVSDAG